MGNWAFGEDEQYENQDQSARYNRNKLVELCKTKELVIKNTYFQKPNKNKCTFREFETVKGPPWNAHRYVELDYICNKSKWKIV